MRATMREMELKNPRSANSDKKEVCCSRKHAARITENIYNYLTFQDVTHPQERIQWVAIVPCPSPFDSAFE